MHVVLTGLYFATAVVLPGLYGGTAWAVGRDLSELEHLQPNASGYMWTWCHWSKSVTMQQLMMAVNREIMVRFRRFAPEAAQRFRPFGCGRASSCLLSGTA
eukprot:3937577-Rhodomonas_salina.2